MQTIEQELFSLSEGSSITKVHNLMRATHTIKGSAANVGLEIIKKIAHSLEDAFKALYNPDVVIDSELQTILLQAYECLSLALNTELLGSTVNHEELLQRATSVFAQLQEKLGDAFGNETHIPSSAELGFDIVQSIFEMGVQQRLESLVEAINNIIDNTEFVDFLREEAEVFLGLAESLNLPGLGEIAQTIIAALQVNPTEVQQIAEIAYSLLETIWGGDVSPNIVEEATKIQTEKEVIRELSSVVSLATNEQEVVDILKTVIQAIPDLAVQVNKELEDKSQVFQTKNSRPHSFVRVDTEGLQRLNYLAGELLICQKRRTLYDEQLQEIFEQLLQRLSRQQATLNQLRDLPLQVQKILHLGC
jgi:chemotaxis protein histidine kinase CheA